MNDGHPDPLSAAIGRVVSRLAKDPDLRDAIRALAELVLQRTEPPAPGAEDRIDRPEPPAESADTSETPDVVAEAVTEPEPEAEASDGVEPDTADRAEERPSPPAPPPAVGTPTGPSEPLHPLTLGQGSPASVELSTTVPTRREDEDEEREEDRLEWIQERCKLKADAIRWAARRRMMERRGSDPDEFEGPERVLVERAQELPNCFLWMLRPPALEAIGDDPALASSLDRAFEVAAEAAELLREVEGGTPPDRSLLTEILHKLAVAQSGLRVAVERVGVDWDSDQTSLFHAVRRAADRYKIYIARYMKMTDRADPSRLPSLSARLKSLTDELVRARRSSRDQKKRMNKIRYLCNKLSEDDGGEEDWRSLASTIDLVVEDGTPPSSTEIREHLIPILDDIPDWEPLPRNFGFVVREVERFLGGRKAVDEPGRAGDDEPTAEVAEVADLLRGRSLVFIANVANPGAKEALIRAFELSDIDWIITQKHQSHLGFESHVAREDVALVLLPIRWSSHGFGQVKEFCETYGRPLVRLRAGYNPNMVAAQILAQASERLRMAAP